MTWIDDKGWCYTNKSHCTPNGNAARKYWWFTKYVTKSQIGINVGVIRLPNTFLGRKIRVKIEVVDEEFINQGESELEQNQTSVPILPIITEANDGIGKTATDKQ